MSRFHGILGIVVILAVAFALSRDRKKIRIRILLWGLGLQLVFGLFLMKTQVGQAVFNKAKDIMDGVLVMTAEGSHFIFGNLVPRWGEPPVESLGYILAFQALPVIIVFSSLMAILYHLGIMQLLVRAFAWIMHKSMGTSGSESLSAAGNVFVGMTESPLLIRPYVERMTTSELMALMTGGFATIAGSVFALYVSFGVSAGHMLTASVMSAPAALMLAKILIPESETSETAGSVKVKMERETQNLIDAAASGAAMGLKLALNVAAMLLAFVALLFLINWLLGWLGEGLEVIFSADLFEGDARLSLAMIFGWIFGWLAWCMGCPAADMAAVGNLLGTKISINELIAYQQLTDLVKTEAISEKSVIISTYALCGFANFGSIAITIAGIGGIAPGRRKDLARLGLKAMLGGALASFSTAALAGILL
ncbi:MAG: NupC/NupG family nucleoside CNT transporter [Planctomycetota bacterium]